MIQPQWEQRYRNIWDDGARCVLSRRQRQEPAHSGVEAAVPPRHTEVNFLTHVLGRRRPRVNSDPIGHQPRLLKTDGIIEVAGKNHRFFIND